MSSAAGSLLGSRYALEERLGAGGYSEVWRAHDVVLDRPVAIKLLHTQHAKDPRTLSRFRREAQLTARLSHPNVAQVYDFCDAGSDGSPYLVMELINGPSLAAVLAHGPLSPADTMDLISQAAAGLQSAHAAGLVHRDIKPANLMLAPGRVVKITDFGISHTLASAPITSTGLLVGTPGYLAPERARGARATQASDIYALGVVGYECLARATPFAGTPLEVAIAHRDLPLPRLPATTPPAVASFIASLTAKDPAARPPGADVVSLQAAQLRDALPGAPPPALGDQLPVSQRPDGDWPTLVGIPLPAQTDRAPAVPRRRAGLIAAGIALAAAGVIAVIAVSLSSGQTPAAAPPSHPKQPAHTPAAIEVSRAGLIGQPVRQVVQQLRQEGFRVQVQRQPNSGDQQPGQVIALRPAGFQPPGSLITVIATWPDHGGNGNGHDRGGNGNGNGDGGGGGG